jgi:hypothetical protein
MKHLHEKFDRIQDPAGKIGEDEPVFLLRAKDIFMPKMLRAYGGHLQEFGNHTMANEIFEFARDIEKWQNKNGCKMPD